VKSNPNFADINKIATANVIVRPNKVGIMGGIKVG